MIPDRRRVLALLLVLAVLAGGGARALASWGVTRSEVASAESAVDLAAQNLAEARGALAQAVDDLGRLEATVVRLGERRQADLASAQTQQVALRTRVATLYMSAGARAATVVTGDVTSFSTRVAYLAAVAEQDRSSLNRFTLSAVEMEALLESAGHQREVAQAHIADLTAQEAVRVAELDVVRARYSEVKQAWDAQEAARIAAEEAELRRQEAALAAQLTTTTTRPASSPTTTRPDYGYVPGGGVEQWRPIVTEVFADWGLTDTKCATRNGIEFCVSGQVDVALQIMRCESRGIPFAENPRSGAAGLFQNLPYYWPERVNRVRVYHSDKSSIPADASIWNPEYNTIVAAMLVWESRETILGNRGGGSVGGVPWPEFNWERYATSGYGYSAWGKGPNPWGHWSCGPAVGAFDSSWVHPWATQQTAP